MDIKEMIGKYESLLAEKAELAAKTESNDAAIKAIKEEIANEMIEEDVSSIGVGDFKYGLKDCTKYSKKSDEKLMAAGVDFFQTLRNEGFGDLIKETVNAQTLNSAMKNYVEEHKELSEDLAAVISTYDYFDISRTKDRSKAMAKAKEKKNG